MNVSFNVVINEANIQDVVSKINSLGIVKAIVNGTATEHSNYGMIQMVTLLDCDRNTFTKIKNRVSIKPFFKSGSAY